MPKTTVGEEETNSPLTITNTGNRRANYDLKLDGPEWLSIEPTQASVGGNSSVDVNLVTKPTEEDKTGKYSFNLIGNNSDLSSSMTCMWEMILLPKT